MCIYNKFTTNHPLVIKSRDVRILLHLTTTSPMTDNFGDHQSVEPVITEGLTLGPNVVEAHPPTIGGPDPILQTRLHRGDIGSEFESAEQNTQSCAANPNSVTPGSLDHKGDIRDCIVHVPDFLKPLAGLGVKQSDGRQSACLNKATGMSDRLGIHYQIIPPGYRTACIVSTCFQRLLSSDS